jgi:hypothetical protein
MAMPGADRGALNAAYDDMLALCEGLETLADALPGRIDAALCHHLIERLEPSLKKLQAAERVLLFPLLASAPEAVERRGTAHAIDAAAAAEVADALRAMMRGEARPSPDALGYLLRSFFDSMRRHVATEREWLRLFAPPQGRIAN